MKNNKIVTWNSIIKNKKIIVSSRRFDHQSLGKKNQNKQLVSNKFVCFFLWKLFFRTHVAISTTFSDSFCCTYESTIHNPKLFGIAHFDMLFICSASSERPIGVGCDGLRNSLLRGTDRNISINMEKVGRTSGSLDQHFNKIVLSSLAIWMFGARHFLPLPTRKMISCGEYEFMGYS